MIKNYNKTNKQNGIFYKNDHNYDAFLSIFFLPNHEK